jgi:hypothetical protein
MSIASDNRDNRAAMFETGVFEFCMSVIAESEAPRVVAVALQFIVSFFRFPMLHIWVPPAVEVGDDRRSALCEAVRACFQRNLSATDGDDRWRIGELMFKCISNLEFWDEDFETPLRAGLHLFFLECFFTEPTPLIQTAEWLESLWVFERNCFFRGAPEFIDGMIGEIPIFNLACLVLDDEEAPPEVRAIHAGLAVNPLLHDRVRGHICAMLTRLIVGSEEVLAELNLRHFFARLLVGMEDRASAFKFDAMCMMAVAFQKLAVSELGDFMDPKFVALLESIELGLRLPDTRDLSGELVAAAYRLNELLPDDSDLKPLLYEAVPEKLRSTFEDLAAAKACSPFFAVGD